VILVLAFSCKEELREPAGSDSSKPGEVTEVQITNLPGRSKITYRLPADQNLLYVKATYVLSSGRNMEVKSSAYTDSLVVEGFADTLEHEVKIVTVSRTEVESSPVLVTVKPTIAPIWHVYKSLNMVNAFGGYKLTAINKTKAPVAILVMKRNVVKEWAVDNNLSVYSSADTIVSRKGGMDTLDINFAVAVRDRWGNITDTLFQDIKPIYEVELNTAKFKHFPLPGDPGQQPGASVAAMWNKVYGWPVSFSSLATETLKVPSIVTIDMGVTAKLSRVWIRPFRELSNLYFGFTTLKRFELWGAVTPNTNGALDGTWTKLGTFELKKPSETPGNVETASDQEAAAAGFYYDIDIVMPEARYLRIKCIENWAGSCPQSVDELKVFGVPR
jgi:hypothetical protein